MYRHGCLFLFVYLFLLPVGHGAGFEHRGFLQRSWITFYWKWLQFLLWASESSSVEGLEPWTAWGPSLDANYRSEEDTDLNNENNPKDTSVATSEPSFTARWIQPLLGEDYMNLFSIWYCMVFECCSAGDCKITNNITGLAMDLHRKLHGQHLAQTVVLKAIRGFLKNPISEKALALSFHGWSGTGKNFVARMIVENLYRDGMKSKCIRIFISVFHFPHARLLEAYKIKLKEEIREVVRSCHQSLFIFDEAEKLPPGLLEIVKPYMNHYENVDGVDYRRSIFLFLSNVAGSTITEVALEFWRAGKSREEITMEDIEPQIREKMLITEGTTPNGGFVGSSLLSDNLIDFFVPFLPLEYRHVKLCTQDAFQLRGVTDITEAMLNEVAQTMVYLPREERLFSAQGCKTVFQRLSYFLP